MLELLRRKGRAVFLYQADVAVTLKTIKLAGDLDFSRKAEIESLLADAHYVDIAVLDVQEVEYLDSSTLGCIVSLKNAMRKNGTAGVIRLAGANHSIVRIFEICGLDKSFELYDSLLRAQNGAKTLAPQ